MYWLLPALVFTALFLTIVLIIFLRRRAISSGPQRIQQAIDTFLQDRDRLQKAFFSVASQSGKPRGLRWIQCEFGSQTAFAKDKQTGQLRGLISTTISFEAIEGGGMEEVEAVGNLRAATAVFHYHQQQWTTDGRVVFNLTPQQTIERFEHELEPVG